MLTLDRHSKLSTMTSSSDLRLRGQRSRKGQISNKLKWQSSSVNVLALDKHQKLFTVTSLSNLWLRGQRSNFTKCRRNIRLCSDLFTDLVSFFVLSFLRFTTNFQVKKFSLHFEFSMGLTPGGLTHDFHGKREP